MLMSWGPTPSMTAILISRFLLDLQAVKHRVNSASGSGSVLNPNAADSMHTLVFERATVGSLSPSIAHWGEATELRIA